MMPNALNLGGVACSKETSLLIVRSATRTIERGSPYIDQQMQLAFSFCTVILRVIWQDVCIYVYNRLCCIYCRLKT